MKCFHLGNLICNVLFIFFLTSYSCWAFASYFATHLYPRSSFYTVPDLTSIRCQSLTKPMSVCWHWGHGGPHFADGVIALHHVGRLQSISPSNHVQLIIYHCHTKLQPAPIHDSNLDPSVCSQVILLYGGRAWNKTKYRNLDNLCCHTLRTIVYKLALSFLYIWQSHLQSLFSKLLCRIPLVASIPPTA